MIESASAIIRFAIRSGVTAVLRVPMYVTGVKPLPVLIRMNAKLRGGYAVPSISADCVGLSSGRIR